jgi:hypothetical protein
MQVHSVELPLKGFGAAPTPARVELASLTTFDRLKRAAIIFGAFVLGALVFLPVPIVHLVLVPGALVLGVVFALVRLRQQEIFRSVQGRCPFCGTEQTFTVMGRFRLPKKLHCSSCQRQLTLEEATTVPPRSPT